MGRQQPGEGNGDIGKAEKKGAEDPTACTPKPSRCRRRRIAREGLERRHRDAQKHQQQSGQTGRGAENRRDDVHFLKVAKRPEGG